MSAVLIYTRDYCGFCDAARDLLRRKGVAFTEIDITGNRERRAEMTRVSGRSTVPQIFIGATHVGGCDDLYALDDAGELDGLLAASSGEVTSDCATSPGAGSENTAPALEENRR
ncbi:MAG TPA: glutaredoxin 3 [Xanthobacteraceae bacterium]|nr:glutaredoxin 3 [Xanthobacteraceae bacterium]